MIDPNNSQAGSILDQVLNQKQTDDIEHFSPLDVLSHLLKVLAPREEEILRRRYGLHAKAPETLEHIGAQYNVTRERIRQIESGAIAKLRKYNDAHHSVSSIVDAISAVLDQHGGAMREDALLMQLLGNSEDAQASRAATLFIMQYLLRERVKHFQTTDDFYPAWQLTTAPVHLVDETIRNVHQLLETHGKPLPVKEVLEQLRKTAFGTEHQYQLTDEAVLSYVGISTHIAKNPYDEYGLAGWGTIVPRRMSDKIYLVLKKVGKPLHFNEITQLINETKFDHRVAYPPTVHNELILNDRYVLVGRGIYALEEWGYKPGVVADILIAIFKREQHPLTRDELVAEVLKQRLVKRNTIHLALTNRKKFTKNSDGTYSLVLA
ncbi:MAG: sigma factor-like helix-turn-helix DNA-binding protein [bacterium]|nr:sigma factor-like helix-turn-helix DNA-binding protein [bacterium]